MDIPRKSLYSSFIDVCLPSHNASSWRQNASWWSHLFCCNTYWHISLAVHLNKKYFSYQFAAVVFLYFDTAHSPSRCLHIINKLCCCLPYWSNVNHKKLDICTEADGDAECMFPTCLESGTTSYILSVKSVSKRGVMTKALLLIGLNVQWLICWRTKSPNVASVAPLRC